MRSSVIHIRKQTSFLVVCMAVVLVCSATALPAAEWSAGFAQTVITPDEPIFMDGYGGRNHPAEGKVHDLFAKAAAFKDPAGQTVVLITTDLVGMPIKMVNYVSAEIEKSHGLKRSQLMFTCSHTHTGPALDHDLSHMVAMSKDDWAKVLKYQKQLDQKIVKVISAAIKDLQPAKLSAGIGKAEFASNRRVPHGLGPYDHEVPVLQARSLDGKTLKGVVFGYACHSTVLSFYKWSGDYGGFAQLYLEDRHPGCVAMFFAGCGADQNPLPRRTVALAEKYGRMLAVGVDKVLESGTKPVTGSLGFSFKNVDLEFERLPTKKELEATAKNNGSRYEQGRANFLLKKIERDGKLSKTYPYPVQVWKIGNSATWVALGGEVVVDYSLRLKKELGLGKTWVTGYANDVMCYIPSERILTEGGYEGASSMIVYQKPSPWKTGLEKRIVDTVHELNTAIKK